MATENLTTASAYFTPTADTPAMFGPDGFAAGFTPKNWRGWLLGHNGNSFGHKWAWCSQFATEPDDGVDHDAALALCEKQAQAWIRSRGYLVTTLPDGSMQVKGRVGHAWGVVRPISGQPDWLGAARWVYEQEKKT